MNLTPRISRGASVEPIPEGWRLSIPAANARLYRLAQLDNCTRVARRDFPYRSLDMRLKARVSSASVPGTWGFGVWNDPYRMAFGPGETIFSALTLPNAAWFFSSSDKSYLSFRDDKPGNGFLAQVFSAAAAPLPALLGVAGKFLFSRARARKALSHLIREEAKALKLDPTQWHDYHMNWESKRVVFAVDGATMLETNFSPVAPLAAVIWIDNQYAAFTPTGKVAFGMLAGPSEWLEITNLELK